MVTPPRTKMSGVVFSFPVKGSNRVNGSPQNIRRLSPSNVVAIRVVFFLEICTKIYNLRNNRPSPIITRLTPRLNPVPLSAPILVTTNKGPMISSGHPWATTVKNIDSMFFIIKIGHVNGRSTTLIKAISIPDNCKARICLKMFPSAMMGRIKLRSKRLPLVGQLT